MVAEFSGWRRVIKIGPWISAFGAVSSLVLNIKAGKSLNMALYNTEVVRMQVIDDLGPISLISNALGFMSFSWLVVILLIWRSEGGLAKNKMPLLGSVEEASEIAPAVEACRAADGINVRGPFSADTVFLRASRGEFDAVVACYHDQAMIPVKCLSFGEAVNVTLGLPFIRTSVDHGTAFDIAGKGIAEHSSMVAAIKLAAELSLKAGESGRALEAA